MTVALCLALAASSVGQENLASGPGIVAIVGNEVITYDRLEKRLALEIYRQGEGWASSEVERARPQLMRQVLRTMIDSMLVLQEARRQAGDRRPVSDREIDLQLEARVKDLRKSQNVIRTVEDYYRAMSDQFGLTRQEVRRQVLEEMTTIRFLWEQVYKDVDTFVSPSEARYFYRTHLEDFTAPVEVSFRHILLSNSRIVPLVLQKIDEGLKEGVSFEELARKYSQEFEDADLRGRLISKSWDDLSQWVPPLPDVLSSLKKGQVSGPVRSERAIHFLKLEDRVEGEPDSFEDCLPRIKDRVRRERRSRAREKLLERLRKDTLVEEFLPGLQGESVVGEEEAESPEGTRPEADPSAANEP